MIVSESTTSDTGLIVGGAVGGTAAVGLLGLLLYFLVRKKSKLRKISAAENGHALTTKQPLKEANV